MPVPNVAADDDATSSWANAVADSIEALEDDLYPTVYGTLELPWAAITGEPATYPPDLHAAAHSAAGADVVTPAAIGAATAAHAHTLAALGAAAAYDTPATADGGKRVYVGSAAPTGMSEGDIWVKG